MPGSPPSRMSDPGTTPPPSTRSNSSMPVEPHACDISTSAYASRWMMSKTARSDWSRQRRRAFQRVPRRASSTRRTRHSGPSTSAPERHTPDRRKRLLEFHASTPNSIAFQLPTPNAARSLGVGGNPHWSWELVVLSFNPCAEATDDLPRDGSDGGRHLARVDALPALITCRPSSTTSSPGRHSERSVTSTVSISIETAPTIGTRRPRIST